MKIVKIKKDLVLLFCAITTAVAAASTSMCVFWFFDECKMPKSLYKVD